MFYKNEKPVGKSEFYFAPGRPSVIKTYNDTGEIEGPWKEWWPNGNLKLDKIAKGGRILQGAEFYPDGRPRVRYRAKGDMGLRGIFLEKYIEAEGWGPNGKSTGKVRNGNGTWIFFSVEPDSVTKQYRGWRHVYKDSLMIKGEKLDSAEMAPWLK
ncbi:MAG TPA: hypothetical protein VK465_03825 [Fibrobacteria bacterium]|nr:hypothetical protein [Fibrobacteria bacterium]